MPDINGAKPRREWLLAGAVYAFFLGLAAARHYLAGGGLFLQVVWDPVGVYSFFTSDSFAIEAVKSGFYPLWDHTRGLGAPHVIPTGGNLDFPLKLIPYLTGGSVAGWEIFILLRLWLAGWFAFLCARELQLHFRGALLAGLAYMLCGYFREFQNLPDISIAMLLPLLLFFSLRLARRRKLGYLLGLYFIVPQMDMSPEATFYITVYGSLFFLAFGAMEWRRTGRPLFGWAVLYLSVMWVATIQNGEALFPFVEYWRHSWHFHPETLGGLHVPVSAAIAFATPAFDFWMAAAPDIGLDNLDQLTIIPGYVGLVVLALALAGLARLRRLPPGLIYTTIMGVVLAGIIFGVPPFAWLARLPLVRYFQNFRYAQPFLAFSVALLAGAGLDGLDERRGRRVLAVIAAVMAVWLSWHVVVFRHELRHAPFIGYALLLAVALAAAAVMVGLVARRVRPALVNLPTALLVAAGLELALYFALAGPVFGPLAHRFEKTPAVDFITARGGQPFRIYATDPRILHPNLAGYYGLSDLRDQTPLYLDDYASLFATVDGLKTQKDVMDHFLRGGRFFFDLDLFAAPENLLDLLNVRYVLSREPLEVDQMHDLIRNPAMSVLAPQPQFFQYIPEGNLGGVMRDMYLLHAPARIDFKPTAYIEGEAGLLENSRTCPDADGVFMVASGQRPEKSKAGNLYYARFVSPKEAGVWRSFHYVFTSVYPLPDETVFSSLPGPRDNNHCDFAAWSMRDLPFESISPFRDPFTGHNYFTSATSEMPQVYDREYRIFENQDYLPRVFAVQKLEPPVLIKGLIEKLQPKLLSGYKGLSPTAVAFTDASPIELSRAEISDIVEEPGRVTFRSRSDGPGFAVISNLYFPGWKAYIDGFETRVYRTDALLQGVNLPMGDSRVELIYDPMSWHPGWWAHLVSWLGIFGLLAWLGLRRNRSTHTPG